MAVWMRSLPCFTMLELEKQHWGCLKVLNWIWSVLQPKRKKSVGRALGSIPCSCSVYLRLFLLGVCRNCALGLASHVYCTYCVFVAKYSGLSKHLPLCDGREDTLLLTLSFHWFTMINITISIFKMFPASGPLCGPDHCLTSLWLVQLSLKQRAQVYPEKLLLVYLALLSSAEPQPSAHRSWDWTVM